MTEQKPQTPPAPPVHDTRRPAVIGLAVVLLLIVGGLLLVHVLHHMSQIQDCALEGRTNCAPVDPAGSGG